MDSQPSLGQFLFLGSLEVLLNQALTLHPQGPETLARLAGTVIRVRAYDPDYIFYCLVDADGIELTTQWDGDARVRVRGSAGALLYRALLPAAEQAPDIEENLRIEGDPETVAALREALARFNLWDAVRTWLREHVVMPDVLGLLRNQDPAWVERLQNLPQLMGHTLDELRRQGERQQALIDEIRSLKETLRAERRTDLVSITTGVALLALALLTATGSLPGEMLESRQPGWDTWLLVALGLALMLSRLVGRRYR
jgi:ubiquinone biosynthesis protein UbiJ